MSKYIKLHPLVIANQNRNSNKSVFREFSPITFMVRILIIMAFLAVAFITVKAFFFESVFFSNILVGLFIIGCLLFVKSFGEQKTVIKKVKNNKPK